MTLCVNAGAAAATISKAGCFSLCHDLSEKKLRLALSMIRSEVIRQTELVCNSDIRNSKLSHPSINGMVAGFLKKKERNHKNCCRM